MGDSRRLNKKYATPSHPWQKARIDEGKEILKEYGLNRMKEIWKAESVAKNLSFRAKALIIDNTEHGDIETNKLLKTVVNLGFLNEGCSLDDVLGLKAKDVLNRRLQTFLVKKGLARTMKQARQMITHKHVIVQGKVVSSPSYIVRKDDEATITFKNSSAFDNEEHPERKVEVKAKDVVKEDKNGEDDPVEELVKDVEDVE